MPHQLKCAWNFINCIDWSCTVSGGNVEMWRGVPECDPSARPIPLQKHGPLPFLVLALHEALQMQFITTLCMVVIVEVAINRVFGLKNACEGSGYCMVIIHAMIAPAEGLNFTAENLLRRPEQILLFLWLCCLTDIYTLRMNSVILLR